MRGSNDIIKYNYNKVNKLSSKLTMNIQYSTKFIRAAKMKEKDKQHETVYKIKEVVNTISNCQTTITFAIPLIITEITNNNTIRLKDCSNNISNHNLQLNNHKWFDAMTDSNITSPTKTSDITNFDSVLP